MKTHVITRFFPAMRSEMSAWHSDLECHSKPWIDKLEKAIQDGAFLKVEFAFGATGRIDGRLILVDLKTGKHTQLSDGEVFCA